MMKKWVLKDKFAEGRDLEHTGGWRLVECEAPTVECRIPGNSPREWGMLKSLRSGVVLLIAHECVTQRSSLSLKSSDSLPK